RRKCVDKTGYENRFRPSGNKDSKNSQFKIQNSRLTFVNNESIRGSTFAGWGARQSYNKIFAHTLKYIRTRAGTREYPPKSHLTRAKTHHQTDPKLASNARLPNILKILEQFYCYFFHTLNNFTIFVP
ncbi:MAG: hypothetical protein IIW74_01570, partial [Rikenellaceae bacterium]|nr:hypothetical protein [Rikenellaceae bacterium]